MLSADEVQNKIEQYQDHIEELVSQIRDAGREAAEAEAEYEMRIAQERLRTRYEANENGVKVTIPVIEDTATGVTEPADVGALGVVKPLLVAGALLSVPRTATT